MKTLALLCQIAAVVSFFGVMFSLPANILGQQYSNIRFDIWAPENRRPTLFFVMALFFGITGSVFIRLS
jgi:hypothetical protein